MQCDLTGKSLIFLLVCVSAMSSRNECAACVSRDVTPLVVAACSEADGTGSVVCVQPVSEGANTGSRA